LTLATGLVHRANTLADWRLMMTTSVLNGVRLYWERTGETGDSLVLVHGSWVDHHTWDPIVPALARTFRVATYDRRGHSESERPAGQGSFTEDVRDLAALIEHLSLSPAHILGNSAGAVIALRLAAEQPRLVRSLLLHDPALFRMFTDKAQPTSSDEGPGLRAAVDLLANGQNEAGARLFVETVINAGPWEQRPEEVRRRWILNAPTFLDEQHDPEAGRVDLQSLHRLAAPVLLTAGDKSPAIFRFRVETLARILPKARLRMIVGAGHGPQLAQPEAYVDIIVGFIREVVAEDSGSV
jgi:pimeloyl-ACP methyl ester carboxylesterase